MLPPLLGLFSTTAHAYVSYQRLGYVSCTSCHQISTGGGMLTPYGRGIQASVAWASRDRSYEEKALAGGAYVRVLFDDADGAANPFLMQLDLQGEAKFSEKTRAQIQAGPNLSRGEEGQIISIRSASDSLVLRRALILADLDDTSRLEVGRDLSPVGLNLTEHTAYIRARNRRNVLDYPTQVRWIYQTDRIQLMPFLLAPSFEERADNREYAAGARVECGINTRNSVGWTLQAGTSPAMSRLLLGPFARLSTDHWNGLLLEALYSSRALDGASSSVPQTTFYARPYVAYPEWIELGWVAEYLRVGGSLDEKSWRQGPTVNLRLHEYVSLIGDARLTSAGGRSDWGWYGQAFAHFQY